MMTNIQIDLTTFSMMVTVITAVGASTWWLSSQFRDVRKLIYDQVFALREFLLSKLEAHEKNDSIRFASLTEDLWTVKVRNAARDGITLLKKDDQNV